ncbi:MAG: response regulator transcription factor [Desulfocapsaceae bacterium]|nr:response regulator transcription factor [Desulfocapsaceae bacterium]
MPDTNDLTRILLVEDHPVFIVGLKELINQEADLKVCGEASDVPSAWKQLQAFRPDMVIVDITLKEGNGIDLVRDISKHDPSLPVLVLSMHEESLYAERALAAGARGYIMKQETSTSIIQAIRCVLGGEIYAGKNLMRAILGRFANRSETPSISPIEKLTDREVEVLEAIGQGLTTKQIAGKLHLSIKTIGTYRERIKEKLGLQNAFELIHQAVRWIEQKSEKR